MSPPRLPTAALPRRWLGTRAVLESQLARLQRLASADPRPLFPDSRFLRRSKIVATLGARVDASLVRSLIGAGANVLRLNCSHGDHAHFARTIDVVRTVQRQLGREDVAIALDTRGPEIRTGHLALGTPAGNPAFCLHIEPGDRLLFSADAALQAAGTLEKGVYVDFPGLGAALSPGDCLMVDDGLLEFRVDERRPGAVWATAVNGGALGERKGINLPGIATGLPAVSDQDRRDIAFGVAHGVDLIFASFISSRGDVRAVREVLSRGGSGRGTVRLIAKVETAQGVANIDDIVEAADGVMVARGDLGIEMAPSKVFAAQKLILRKCAIAGKPSICATQMLESMVQGPRPTRAEVTDVANAVLDGADCVMLSGETAKGKFPVQAVRTMATLCLEAEAVATAQGDEPRAEALLPRATRTVEAVAAAAARTAHYQGASVLLVATDTGEAPRLAAKYRPDVPIVAACADLRVARQCAVVRGVTAVLVPAAAAAAASAELAPQPAGEDWDMVLGAVREVKRLEIAPDDGLAVVMHKVAHASATTAATAGGTRPGSGEGSAGVGEGAGEPRGGRGRDWVMRLLHLRDVDAMQGGATSSGGGGDIDAEDLPGVGAI